MEALKALAFSVAVLLAACSTAVPYTAGKSPTSPQKFVERVLYEQATDTPPEAVRVSQDFFEVVGGSVTSVNRITRRETTHREVTRVYYRSIAKLSLYQKRGAWYVVPEAADGRELATVVTSSESDAKQFIDALVALKAQAS